MAMNRLLSETSKQFAWLLPCTMSGKLNTRARSRHKKTPGQPPYRVSSDVSAERKITLHFLLDAQQPRVLPTELLHRRLNDETKETARIKPQETLIACIEYQSIKPDTLLQAQFHPVQVRCSRAAPLLVRDTLPYLLIVHHISIGIRAVE